MGRDQSVRVLLVSPKPPPAHGAAKAVETLLDGCGGVDWDHIDARYSENVAQLQKASFRKIGLLLGYLWSTAIGMWRCRVVVLTPSFQRGSFIKDSLFVWLCSLFPGRDVVAWYHMSFRSMNFETLSPLFRWYVRLTMGRIDWHVCVAGRLVGEMPEFIPTDRIVPLPNGVSPYEGSGREESGTAILYLSHFGLAKGWRVLLDAAERVCERHSDVEFRFYGSPAMETTQDDVEKAFAASAFCDRVRWLGYADDTMKPSIFREVDALCFPSLNEAFPITVLEAMSAGLPIVASDVGGIADAVVDGEGGLLVTPGDSSELEKALEALVSDSRRGREWGQFNRERYLKLFTDEAFCARWEEFLTQLPAATKVALKSRQAA